MKCWNPNCSNVLGPKAASCPLCGWDRPNKQPKAYDPEHWRCCDRDPDGNRCAAPGALSESTRGSDRWYCSAHYPPFKTRGYKRTPPPPGLLDRLRDPPKAGDLAADLLERQAIQNEGPPTQ